MKRKILLTITLMMIIFIPNVRAEGNMKVIFNTSFEEQINVDKIDKIFIMMDDANRKDYELVLKHQDNFRFELDNLPQGDIYINSITVSRDYTVEYDYKYAITKTSEEETNVSLLVTKVEKDPNRKRVQITQEEIAEMLGYDPLKLNTNQTTTSKKSEETSTNSVNPDEPVDINPHKESSKTTTQSQKELTALEEEQKAEERKEEQKKRNSIYLYVVLAFLAVIIVFAIIAGIKIANANK